MFKFIISVIIYLVLVIVQFVLPQYVSIVWWVYPNFILMYTVYTALNEGSMDGQMTGFIYGLTWDILSTDIFGIRTLTFTVSGYLIGMFNRKLNKNQPLTQIIAMGICLIISQSGLSLAYIIVPNNTVTAPFELGYFVWLSVLCNLVFTPFVFKLLSIIRSKY